jgi:predicted RNA binding protein YcfA (HicA-like mRNA interferase family)
MSKYDKLIEKILAGRSDKNIAFNDLCSLLSGLGFSERIKGSHHIFYMNGIEEIINLQPVQGLAKSYQIKQIRNILVKYRLGGTNE